MDAYVIKVQFEDSLRRLPLEEGDLAFSYTQLVARTKDLFEIPATAQLLFTYTDRDSDVVTMAEDHDLRDALVTQALNPLRLHLALLSGEPKATTTDVKMNDSAAEREGEKTPQATENKNDTEPQAGNGDSAAAAETPRNENPRVSEQAVHKGVTCDECGMTPITGPRYKSMTLDDFDLCQDCFDKPGVDPSDFIKIRRGRPDRRSVHFGRGFGPGHGLGHGPGHGHGHGPRDEHGHGLGHGPPGHGHGHGPRGERGFRHHKHGMDWKDCSGRACESARAEKQRSGEAVHHGVECDECKTTPIVGPRYKSETQFNFDLCQNCYQKVASASSSSDEYTRIERQVRYMPRYYHLASPFSFYRFSPYGRPFCGRRIRRIMVTTVSEEEEEQRRAQRTAAARKSDAAPQEAPAASTDVRMGEQEGQIAATIADNPEAAATGAAEVAMTEVGDGDKSQSSTKEVAGEQQQQERVGTEPAMAEPAAAAGDVLLPHEGMVAKLAAMGFNDGKLNEELLRKNNFDLRSTLDDLCAVKNWDPVLEELQGLGFSDSELNKRLLAQNDGNVRAVVRELVRLTKQQVDSGLNGEKQT